MAEPAIAGLAEYAASSRYLADLSATQDVWAAPVVMPTAGIMIFLTYLTAPVLLGVMSNGVPRLVVDVDGERTFLVRLLGLEPADHGLRGGIANPHVRALANDLRVRHMKMQGIQRVHMDVMATVIALSAFQVREADATGPVDEVTAGRCWTYLRYAMATIGARLAPLDEARAAYDRFIDEECHPSPHGQASINMLRDRYPRHFARALDALPAAVRAAACRVVEDCQR